MFVYIWEYDVMEANRAAFERIYGPAGDWVQLFRQGTGHIRTELLHDVARAGRYVTIDYWESRPARDRFREQFAASFAALDAHCVALTERETSVGDFETVQPTNQS
jgi:heme-degrading monooxygenase HmoA